MFNILIIGEGRRTNELLAKIANNANISVISENDIALQDIATYHIVFEMNADRRKTLLIDYGYYKDTLFVKSAVFTGIDNQNNNVIGMNLMAGFINRDLVEVSTIFENTKENYDPIFTKLNWETAWVKNRVGMVTPRIVCMIINEAFYTLQEGTANKEDINTGMKLGTNYPHGPFEWFEIIGKKDVYELLSVMYEDTKDERYKICPMLKMEAMS